MGRVWFLRPRHGPKPKPEPLRKSRADLRLRPAGPANARSARDPGTHRLVPGLPARVREPPAGGQSVRLLAHRRAASNDVAAGAPCASHRGGDGETAGAAAGAAVVRAGMGTGRALASIARGQAPRGVTANHIEQAVGRYMPQLGYCKFNGRGSRGAARAKTSRP